eukprot:NODE_7133_length_807_cov_39.972222_g6527_i0.p1 GENE.NODE_7133_length_807_cov_39.972222_g6527_i0~~NODE_7133_length_807_cov_39.972222_g6527_i0.p1  ORF type:complete len:242 (+),score=42.02 NODE_7133_length_807_cov_39.972222_g6527_i0:88-726(+)
MRPCRDWSRGACKNTNCSFKHDLPANPQFIINNMASNILAEQIEKVMNLLENELTNPQYRTAKIVNVNDKPYYLSHTGHLDVFSLFDKNYSLIDKNGKEVPMDMKGVAGPLTQGEYYYTVRGGEKPQIPKRTADRHSSLVVKNIPSHIDARRISDFLSRVGVVNSLKPISLDPQNKTWSAVITFSDRNQLEKVLEDRTTRHIEGHVLIFETS